MDENETCQAMAPGPSGIKCGKRPHPERIACAATGTSEEGIHWSVTWWKPGTARGDVRADGRPWPDGHQVLTEAAETAWPVRLT